MAKIKSFSTNDGDMFYIRHNSDNFTMIDCCIDDNADAVIEELERECSGKGIRRFISTHPDDDHIRGLKELNSRQKILNFYCVDNQAIKDDPTDDFEEYRSLRDGPEAFLIHKGCSRKWMNVSDAERGRSGINVLWPDTDNEDFKKALESANKGESPNNISPIITYAMQDNVTVYWFGDLETDYMEKIQDFVTWKKADVVFAPHHGRSSGKIPKKILDKIDPKIIIVGEAPCEDLDYYSGYNTITQNTAHDIVINCVGNHADFYVSNMDYDTAPSNLVDIEAEPMADYKYVGSLRFGDS